MRFNVKRHAVIASLLIVSSIMLFSCANSGADVISSSLNVSSSESASSEGTTNSQEALDNSAQPEGSSSEFTPVLGDNITSPASSATASSIVSSKKAATAANSTAALPAVSSKSSSSKAASSKAASSKAASSKAASSAAVSSKTVSSQTVSTVPAGNSNETNYGPRISDDSSKSSNTSFYASVEDQIFAQLNDLRTSKGLNPLKKNSSLAAGARIRAKEMYDYNYFAHTRPDGGSWDSVFKNEIKLSGYTRLGENLVMMVGSTPDATAIMKLWINSPGHYANMVNPDYTHVGLGVFCGTITGKGKSLYAVQEFGTF